MSNVLLVLIAIGLIVIGSYQIGYQRGSDGQTTVINGATMTWQQALDLRQVRSAHIIVRRSTITGVPSSIRTEADFFAYLRGLKWHAKKVEWWDNELIQGKERKPQDTEDAACPPPTTPRS